MGPYPEDIADKIQELAPRLVVIAQRLAQPNGMQRGANNALKIQKDGMPEAQSITQLLHRDAMQTAVIRACALLEQEGLIVSFARIYHLLKDERVGNILIARQIAASDRDIVQMVEHNAIKGLSDFHDVYRSIVGDDTRLFVRLFHMRNYYLAHIDEEDAPTSINYSELDFICEQMVRMAVAVTSLASNKALIYDDEIKIYSERAEKTMLRALVGDK